MKIITKYDSIKVMTGGTLMAIGTGIAGIIPIPFVQFGGGALFLLGLAITALGFFKLALPEAVYFEKWKQEEVRKALTEAPRNSTVRILQTWFPDAETFIPNLEQLLTKGDKHFQLRIMLMDNDKASVDKPDVLSARIKHRSEGRREASDSIDRTVKALMAMKRNVDKVWKEKRDGALLDMQIKRYCFLPFGPIYQVGPVMLTGFYLNHSTSANGPMIKLTSPDSDSWAVFQKHFDTAWEVAQVNRC